MLTSDSMTLLWLTYLGLSLVVLLTGYLGLAFLPRLLRLPITWAVAGVLWIPTRFRLPLLDEGEFYTGMAPAVVVASVAFLERNAEVLLSSGLLVGAGAGLGVALGLLQWWAWRRSEEAPAASQTRTRQDGSGAASAGQGRREPMIG
ncbi:hypothetical protein [Halomonas faecis]|uniref:hypothetical protein n=1 Tax=Halomonas faecis TaxID=1562110 RepID=UPI001969CC53|nr:hypothetical protein [Halomonas faecis]